MNPEGDSFLQRYKLHIVVISVVVAVVVYLQVWGSPPPPASKQTTGGTLMETLLLFANLCLLGAMLVMASRVMKIVETLNSHSQKMEEVTEALIKIGDGLNEINQSTRLSETAKAIAFRDTERASLEEAVSAKLNDRDFEAAYELIDEITQRPGYHELGVQLRLEADRHRSSVRHERVADVIARIETLLVDHEWSKASVQIEGLVQAYPDSERARAMRQRLFTQKEEHKKSLLNEWDQSVQRSDTDRGLEILKELDHYLSPNEALALQEAAKDVFRTKLHNLGVKFSLAVSDKNWTEALDVGQQIITNFPNSKMSEEILTKMDVLKQNVQL